VCVCERESIKACLCQSAGVVCDVVCSLCVCVCVCVCEMVWCVVCDGVVCSV